MAVVDRISEDFECLLGVKDHGIFKDPFNVEKHRNRERKHEIFYAQNVKQVLSIIEEQVESVTDALVDIPKLVSLNLWDQEYIKEFEVEQIETSTIYPIGSVTTRSGKKQEDSKLSVERAELRKLKPNVTPVGGDRLSQPIEVIPTPKSNWYSLSITKDELIELQKEDLSLKTCFIQVGCQKKIQKVKFF